MFSSMQWHSVSTHIHKMKDNLVLKEANMVTEWKPESPNLVKNTLGKQRDVTSVLFKVMLPELRT